MNDETNNAGNFLAHRIAQVEDGWKAKGEIHAKSTVKGVEELMHRKDDAHVCGADAMTQPDLCNQLMTDRGAGKLENDAVSVLPQNEYDAWYMREFPHSKKAQWLRKAD